MADLSHITHKMEEIRSMLILAIDEDDPYAEELVGEIKVLRGMMKQANLPRALWIPHYESLDPYLENETLSPQDAANCHDMIDAWLEE